MDDLTKIGALPATSAKTLAQIDALEAWMLKMAQPDLDTEHIFHAGMYARTIRMPQDMVLTGALMKRATLVIVSGHARVLAGDTWLELEGYHVLPASQGRKQVFVSVSELFITMVFPTQATTVEAAEGEFTDQASMLLSRRQQVSRVFWTGE